jgi:hypothetical protein
VSGAHLVQLAAGVDVQGHRLQAPRQVRHVVQVLVHVHVGAARHLHRPHDLRRSSLGLVERAASTYLW